mgnify:CR=1 FL=1
MEKILSPNLTNENYNVIKNFLMKTKTKFKITQLALNHKMDNSHMTSPGLTLGTCVCFQSLASTWPSRLGGH